MTEVSLHPATVDRVEDALAVLGSGGGAACCCQYWRLSSSAYSSASVAKRRSLLSAQTAATPVPGLLAYVEEIPAGWCGFGIRDRMERLVRSRTIPVVDDEPVWSIFCFTVRVGYRRLGLSRALLDGVIKYARENGAPAVEAYPIDPAGSRVHATAAYVGTSSMFEDAGFRRVAQTQARSARLHRWLMRLDLRQPS
jgi:ribosomal protein S18 acetylase RimI-like enzyme